MLNVYCFTTSYNRPYYLYNIINNILNQSFQDIKYCININIDNESNEILYKKLLYDLTDSRLNVIYSYNEKQHVNYIKALSLCPTNPDSIYLKIDDDDIYHKEYISKVVDAFNNNADYDIISSNIHKSINNNKIIKQKMNSIGTWRGDDHKIKFGFPTTYAFNHKAKEIIHNITNKDYATIHPFEDAVWRTFWRQHNLKSLLIDNEHFTYHIHGQNISSSFMLENYDVDDKLAFIENDYCLISMFKHKLWQSYIICNKRNNRCYHINNDDHGIFTIDKNNILIFWEKYNLTEVFYKTNNYYQLND